MTNKVSLTESSSASISGRPLARCAAQLPG